jgi:hypothetical protein
VAASAATNRIHAAFPRAERGAKIVQRAFARDAWETCASFSPAVERLGTERLKPIFEEFEGRISYDDIRLVVAHRVARVSSGAFFTRSRGDAEETRLSPRPRVSA